jgi:hypothetical protein
MESNPYGVMENFLVALGSGLSEAYLPILE